jgi:UDP-GlcNAc:undecaprenyl-phosphate GlcNAc-1-phosphate transferase
VRGVAFLAFVLTLAFTPLAIWALRRLHVIDVPTERSSHVSRTPRGGGVGVFLGAVSGLILAGSKGVVEAGSLKTLLVCSSFFAIVGLVDDVRTLNVKPRLAAQAACAVLFVAPWFFENGPALSVGFRAATAAAAVVWVMGFLNVFNFMDGINGISALHTVLAGGTLAFIGHTDGHRIVEVCGVTIAAAALGFLPYNFPRARVFLGDVGSYFIGTWLAISVLIALVWKSPPEAVLGPLVIYLADTSFTLVNRVRQGKQWSESHHEHIYQQLIDRGWSHVETSLTVLAFSTACMLLGLVSLTTNVTGRIVADLLIPVVALGYLAVPRLLARATRRRASAATVTDGATSRRQAA